MKIRDAIFPRLNTASDRDKVPTFPEGVRIPKIIHQTFYDRALPAELQKNVDKLKGLNPEWEYRFYDDTDIKNFIDSNYPPFVSNYFYRIDKAYGAARADLFRYLLMYKCGGVYLDIKSSLNKPFSKILKSDDRYLLSFWKNRDGERFEGWGKHAELSDSENGEYQQWHIACAPGHPFLKAVIENVLSNIDKYNPALHGTGKYGVLRLTGPIAYTVAISRLTSKCKCRIVDSQTDLGFEYSVYQSTSHTGIFKTHYSALTDSIVRLGVTKKNSALLIQGVQRLKRRITSKAARSV
jgi:mannosyltransferase OCH1-like enzyme